MRRSWPRRARITQIAIGSRASFTARYEGLLRYYGLEGRMIQTGRPNENGDVEQRHHRFKRALDQSLMLRGSREFATRADYEVFLQGLFERLNAGRREKLAKAIPALRALPAARLDSFKKLPCRVGQGSTINVDRNVYSVPSRLIGAKVEVRLYAETLEVWYGQTRVETLPRLRGRKGHHINYRHVIGWLVRKPGAFEGYLYRADLFPTSRFRMAYGVLKRILPSRAHKEYLRILKLAARENESAVDEALRFLIDTEQPISLAAVEALVHEATTLPAPTDVHIDDIDLDRYDALLDNFRFVEMEVAQ